MKRIKIAVGIVVLFSAVSIAELFVPSIFGSNMVLQENSDTPLWGTASVGCNIVIKATWLDKQVEATADGDGRWKCILKTPSASFTPYVIDVQAGSHSIRYENVLIGQVWLCSGQSNMAYSLNRTENADKEAAAADYPHIRFYQGEPVYSDTVLKDTSGKWENCTPLSAAGFSAVGYYFGKELFTKLNKPIGLINFSWGGTPVEAWMRPQALEKCPEYNEYLKAVWLELDKKYPQSKRDYDIALEMFRGGQGKEPSQPRELRLQNKPSYCYNGMIAPIAGYTLAGVIWYQGEANTPASNYPHYQQAFTALIGDWRDLWGKDDLPFLYVQLAASTGYKMGVAHIRQAQMMVMKNVPHTGMAVTMDIGDAGDHHPKNKRDVGYRLSLWALKDVYGFKNIIPSGPVYKSKKIEGNKIRLYFDYADEGLVAKDGNNLTNFEVCGQDGQFYPAVAKIDKNTVLVYSPQVSHPKDVSFAWMEYAEPNFYNRSALPASPFNTCELENF